MFGQTSILKLISMVFMTVIFVLVFSLAISWTLQEFNDFETDSKNIEDKYMEARKAGLRLETEEIIRFIAHKKNLEENEISELLQARTLDAYSIAMDIYRNNEGHVADDEIKQFIIARLKPMRFDNGLGYYFAVTGPNYRELLADRPELAGRALKKTSDVSAEALVRGMVGLSDGNDEGFIYYDAPKPNTSAPLTSKLAYMMHFQPYDWYIGTGVYLDDVQRDLQNQVLDWLFKVKPRTGTSTSIIRFDGTVLFHDHKQLIGQNILGRTEIQEQLLYRKILETRHDPDGKFSTYTFGISKKEEKYPKIAFAKPIEDWHWIIVEEMSTNELTSIINEKKAELKKNVFGHILRTALLVFIFIILVIFISNLLSRKIDREFKVFSLFFESAATNRNFIDKDNLNLLDFKRLADSANGMIQSLKTMEEASLQSREKIQKQSEFLKNIIEALTHPFYVVDCKTREIVLANSALKLDPGIEHPICYDITYGRPEPCDGQNYPCPIKMVTESKKPVVVEHCHTDADGQVRQIEIHAYPITGARGEVEKIIEYCLDVTDRKRVEEDLLHSELRYRSLFDSISDPIFIHGQDGLLKEINRSAGKILGYDRKELLGLNLMDLTAAGQAETMQKAFQNLKMPNTFSLKLSLLHRDGRRIPMEINSRLIMDRGEEAILSVARDISENKRAQEERAALEKHVRQAHKMEAIGTLAGGIAHDFNNILGAIIGFAELAQMKAAERGFEQDYFEMVLEASYRAKELVHQILSISRRTEQEKKPVMIGPIIKETLKLLRASIPTTVRIVQEINVIDAAIMADPTQVHQIIMNLGANASQAMAEKGGQLTVSLDEVEISPNDLRLKMGLIAGRYLRLTVNDTGMGIDPGVRDRIFDPYFTTKKAQEGTGLGLSIVHGIVKSYGGEIRVYSEPGMGSTFSLYLPALEDFKTDSESREELPLQRGNERILFIDDEQQLVRLGSETLKMLGYEVIAQISSLKALEIFRLTPEKFDLVITDLTMPEMTGLELAKKIKETRADIPIILCTGFSAKIASEKYTDAGISQVVMKPILTREISRIVRQELDKARSGQAG